MPVSPITQQYPTTAYLTVDEYLAAPTSVDTTNLVDDGNSASQLAMLATQISRASSAADTYCGQILSATVDVDNGWCRWQSGKGLRVICRYNPVIEVQAFALATNPAFPAQTTSITAIDQIIFDSGQVFTVPIGGGLPTSSFGGVSIAPNKQFFCQWTYVNGYANTLLAADVAVGDVSLTVVDATGIYPGHPLRIFDPLNAADENLIVSAVTGTTVSLGAPLTFAHAAGVGVSALPPAIKQAVVQLTSALINARGDEAIVLASISMPGGEQTQSKSVSREMEMATMLLDPFRSVGVRR